MWVKSAPTPGARAQNRGLLISDVGQKKSCGSCICTMFLKRWCAGSVWLRIKAGLEVKDD